jgi:hypothetical protein
MMPCLDIASCFKRCCWQCDKLPVELQSRGAEFESEFEFDPCPADSCPMLPGMLSAVCPCRHGDLKAGNVLLQATAGVSRGTTEQKHALLQVGGHNSSSRTAAHGTGVPVNRSPTAVPVLDGGLGSCTAAAAAQPCYHMPSVVHSMMPA